MEAGLLPHLNGPAKARIVRNLLRRLSITVLMLSGIIPFPLLKPFSERKPEKELSIRPRLTCLDPSSVTY